MLQQKKNLRLVKLKLNPANAVPLDVRSVGAESFLVQERDLKKTSAVGLEVVTERHPSEDELKAMLFGWRAVKHLKSNAILYACKDRTLGVGAGQMSRVDSSRIAVWKAGEAGLDLKGSAVCSDAFFPGCTGSTKTLFTSTFWRNIVEAFFVDIVGLTFRSSTNMSSSWTN